MRRLGSIEPSRRAGSTRAASRISDAGAIASAADGKRA
jgi:hypothetical protein